MIEPESASCTNVTADQWRDWLRNGVLRMCGLLDGADRAFEPWAGHIGRAREFSWVDELARFAIALDSTARFRFDRGLDEALVGIAGSGLSQGWIAVLNVLDLMRSIGAQERCRGLTALADALAQNSPSLEIGLRRQLAAAGLLTASEAEGKDRIQVRIVAVRLAAHVLATNSDAAPSFRENVRRRLSRIGVPLADLGRLGLLPDDAQVVHHDDYVSRYKYGLLAGGSVKSS